jgi:hypothetical protein
VFSGTLERLCSFYNCNMANVKKSVHAFGLLGDVKEEALQLICFGACLKRTRVKICP